MFKNASFYTLCIICLFLSSCVSKSRYTELETSLGTTETQLKERNEAFSDLQAHNYDLQSENAGLSGTIEDLTHNLDQAQSDIREKQGPEKLPANPDIHSSKNMTGVRCLATQSLTGSITSRETYMV